MKHIKLVFMSLLVITVFSCKDGKKEKNVQDSDKPMFSLLSDSTKVSFTAYKTTEKKPVGGVFKNIKITKSIDGKSPMEALNGTEFSIPVSSLFTNDATNTRDAKLLEFFFGVMKDTELISGTFKSEGDKCSIDVTLNGETANIPLEYEKDADLKIIFSGVMDLEKWNALEAVASLNKACEALHTGPDGVSKTWNEVAVKAEVQLRKK